MSKDLSIGSPDKYLSTKVQMSSFVIEELDDLEESSSNSCSDDLEKMVPSGLLDDFTP